MQLNVYQILNVGINAGDASMKKCDVLEVNLVVKLEFHGTQLSKEEGCVELLGFL